MNTIYSVLDAVARFSGLGIHNHILATMIVAAAAIMIGYVFAAIDIDGERVVLTPLAASACIVLYAAIVDSYQVESWPRFFLMATVWSVIVLTASGFAGYYYTRSQCKA